MQIPEYFVQRSLLEVTFEEVRTHLGAEMQRRWTGLAIVRPSPALLGLSSLVTVMVHERWQGYDVWTRRALRKVPTFRTSEPGRKMSQVAVDVIERLAAILCHATYRSSMVKVELNDVDRASRGAGPQPGG